MKTTFAAFLLLGSFVLPQAHADLALAEVVPTVVYNAPVVYTAPVVYQQPVVYNAPVVYQSVVYDPAACNSVVYNPATCSTVYNPAASANVVVVGNGTVGAYRTSIDTTPTVIYFGRGHGSTHRVSTAGCSGFSRRVVCR